MNPVRRALLLLFGQEDLIDERDALEDALNYERQKVQTLEGEKLALRASMMHWRKLFHEIDDELRGMKG